MDIRATETWPSIFHSIYLAAQFSHVLDYDTDDEGNERHNPITQPLYDNSELLKEQESIKSKKSRSPKNKVHEEP